MSDSKSWKSLQASEGPLWIKSAVPSSLTVSSELSRFNSSVATAGLTLDQKVTAGLQQNFHDYK